MLAYGFLLPFSFRKQETVTQLRAIKGKVDRWPTLFLPHWVHVVLIRPCIGHTCLARGHLNAFGEPIPTCAECDARLEVSHILGECLVSHILGECLMNAAVRRCIYGQCDPI